MTSAGNDSTKQLQESPFLLNELKLTKMALKHEIDQRAKLENNYCEQLFSQLKPLPVRFFLYTFLLFEHIKLLFCKYVLSILLIDVLMII